MKRVLVVLDPTAEEQPALQRAAWLARHLPAELELFVCEYDQYLAGERFFDSAALEKARMSLIDNRLRALRERAAELERQGLKVRVDARWDHPLHDGIVRKVSESPPDLVLKDTHYHAVLRRSIFSNTDWNLIRTCPSPLWLVKPRPVGATPHVLAAVDPLHEHDKPAELDHRILAAAKEIAEAVRGELHVFHAYDIAPALAVSTDAMTMPIAMPVRELADALKRRHGDAVFALTDGHGIDRRRVHLLEGATRQLLVELSEQLPADLVVIGAVSRSGLKRLFLGSTAEQVLDHLPCDVLIIKPAAPPAEQ
ncbi:MAG TPA: universal stress protein [Gammaproteobacteria bacterium]